MLDIEKVKNLLIKLDLKYKATKDQINMNGIILLFNFDKEYEEFNTVNALDVLNKLENQLAITEKALELLAQEYICYTDEVEITPIIKQVMQEAKEMLENE